MTVDVVEVRPASGYRLFLRFEDGVQGEVDVAGLISFDGVFAWIRDPQHFAEVRLLRELGTIGWPNGADLDPDVLYATVTGKPVKID